MHLTINLTILLDFWYKRSTSLQFAPDLKKYKLFIKFQLMDIIEAYSEKTNAFPRFIRRSQFSI